MLVVIPLVRPSAQCSVPNLIEAMERAFQKFSPGANHNLLVVAAPDARANAEILFNKLQKYFSNSATEILVMNHSHGWPRENNFYFQQACHLVAKYAKSNQGWLWMDLSCVPVSQNWATVLEQEYYLDIQTAHIEKREPYRFMGAIEETIKSSFGEKTVDGYHMASCGIYPGDFYNCPVLKSIHSVGNHFSAHLKWYPVKSLKITPFIQNNRDTGSYKLDGDGIQCESLANNAWDSHWNNPVGPNTVLLCGCLDGSLIDIVPADRAVEATKPVQVEPPKSEAVTSSQQIHPALKPPVVRTLADLQKGNNRPVVKFDEKTGMVITAPVEEPPVTEPETEKEHPIPRSYRKKRRGGEWTPERRAKQAELLRQRIAAKKQSAEPVPA